MNAAQRAAQAERERRLRREAREIEEFQQRQREQALEADREAQQNAKHEKMFKRTAIQLAVVVLLFVLIWFAISKIAAAVLALIALGYWLYQEYEYKHEVVTAWKSKKFFVWRSNLFHGQKEIPLFDPETGAPLMDRGEPMRDAQGRIIRDADDKPILLPAKQKTYFVPSGLWAWRYDIGWKKNENGVLVPREDGDEPIQDFVKKFKTIAWIVVAVLVVIGVAFAVDFIEEQQQVIDHSKSSHYTSRHY